MNIIILNNIHLVYLFFSNKLIDTTIAIVDVKSITTIYDHQINNYIFF